MPEAASIKFLLLLFLSKLINNPGIATQEILRSLDLKKCEEVDIGIGDTMDDLPQDVSTLSKP